MGVFSPFSRKIVYRQAVNAVNWADVAGKVYLKIRPAESNWEAMYRMEYGANSRSLWDARLQEISVDSFLGGFQMEVPWGLYEKGAGGGDFSNLDYLVNALDDCHSIGKKVILVPFLFREFRNPNVSNLPLIEQYKYILPQDLNGYPFVDGNANGLRGFAPGMAAGFEHYLNDNAYAYSKSLVAGAFGYNLKTYKSSVRNRMIAFAQAVANRVGNHPAVFAINTTESAISSNAMYTGQYGFQPTEVAAASTADLETLTLQGKTTILNACRTKFSNLIMGQDMNIPKSPYNYLSAWHAGLVENKYCLRTSNSNWWNGNINEIGSANNPKGILYYYPDFTGVCPKIVDMQGDEVASGGSLNAPIMDTTAKITQRYADIYRRATIGGVLSDGVTNPVALGAHILVVQREHPHPFWLGGTSNPGTTIPSGIAVPSWRDWLVNTADRNWLVTTRPSYVTYNN